MSLAQRASLLAGVLLVTVGVVLYHVAPRSPAAFYVFSSCAAVYLVAAMSESAMRGRGTAVSFHAGPL